MLDKDNIRITIKQLQVVLQERLDITKDEAVKELIILSDLELLMC